jgi:hypothetical protein
MTTVRTYTLELIRDGLEIPNERTIANLRRELERKGVKDLPDDPRHIAAMCLKHRKNYIGQQERLKPFVQK